jgi:hypothetical protein
VDDTQYLWHRRGHRYSVAATRKRRPFLQLLHSRILDVFRCFCGAQDHSVVGCRQLSLAEVSSLHRAPGYTTQLQGNALFLCLFVPVATTHFGMNMALGWPLNSAMRACARVRVPVCPELFARAPGRVAYWVSGSSPAAWAFPPVARDGILGSLPAHQTTPICVRTSIATCDLAPAMGALMSRSFILLLLHSSVLQLAPLATLQLCGTLIREGNTMRTTRAPGMRSARYPSRRKSS